MNISLNWSKWFWLVIFISLASFLIKLSGLDWGFPATLHSDESNLVRSSLGMRFGDLNPHHFDWPSLYFYINYFFFIGFIKFRTLLQILFSTETMQNTFPFWWEPDLPFYYISRMLTSAFLSLNIIMVYILAKEYKVSNKLATLAATIFALGYLANFNSFYGLSDTAIAFFTTITTYFCTKILKNGKTQDYLLAGIFAGLTTSIKYSAVIICLLILIAHLMHTRKINILSKNLFLAATAAIVFFFIGTPYAVLDWETFTRTDGAHGALWQIQHMGHGFNWLYHISVSTPENFGWFATILGFFSVYLIIKSKNYIQMYLLITYFILLAFIGSWGIIREHYSLPLFPFFAIIITIGLSYILSNFNKNIFYIVVACVLIPPIISNATELIKRNNIDTRISSGEWVTKNIPEGSSILSTHYQTGYYGGYLPVFEYDKYKIYKIGSEEKTPDDLKTYYLIKIDKEEIESYDSKNKDLLYELNNSWTTGPKIDIYRITETN